MTDKTPVGTENGDEIEEIFEEILQDTPVGMKLKHGASSKRERTGILDFLLKWVGIMYLNCRFLIMSNSLAPEQQWRKWYKGLLGFLEPQLFVAEFFKLGRYLRPMEVVEEVTVDKELPTKRSLASTFNQMTAMSNGGSNSGEKKKKTIREDLKDDGGEGNYTNCLVYDKHPIFDICDICENVKDMNAANKFYVKVLMYIMNVIKFAVQDNNKALGIFIKYDKNVVELFVMMEELTKEFSVKTDFGNSIRISRFGITKMREANCRTIDDFINYIYGEKRWLYDNFGTIKSDSEMIKALVWYC